MHACLCSWHRGTALGGGLSRGNFTLLSAGCSSSGNPAQHYTAQRCAIIVDRGLHRRALHFVFCIRMSGPRTQEPGQTIPHYPGETIGELSHFSFLISHFSARNGRCVSDVFLVCILLHAICHTWRFHFTEACINGNLFFRGQMHARHSSAG